MSDDFGVLIVGFLRTDYILALIEQAFRHTTARIYLALDGPRNSSELELQDQMLAAIDKIFPGTESRMLIRRNFENLGSGAAVISAIDWVFLEEDKALILEDDLVIDSDFFTYGRAIQKSIDASANILMWTGTRLDPTPGNQSSLVNYPVVWGWGTSRNKWQIIRNLILKREIQKSSLISAAELAFWKIGARRAQMGVVDAWDIPLAAQMISQGYYCAIPSVNLVTNLGFDIKATHTQKNIWPLGLYRQKYQLLEDALDTSQIAVQKNNNFMRVNIYRVRKAQRLLNLISIFLDPLRFPHKSRRKNLWTRLGERS